MRRKFAVLVGFLALAACTAPPPAQPTAAELTQPHTIIIYDGTPEIRIDADNRLVGSTGLVISSPVPGTRVRSSQELTRPAGTSDSSQLAQLFSASFRDALRQSVADLPSMRMHEADDWNALNNLTRNGTGLGIMRDVMFTTDATMLVARATVVHSRMEGSVRRGSRRQFLVFSAPVDAAPGADTMAAWTANRGRLLRERLPQMAQELALLIRTVVLSGEVTNYAALPEAVIHTPGAPLLFAADSTPVRLPTRKQVRVVRQEGGRALVITRLAPELSNWTWISLPDTALEPNRRS